MPLVIDSTEPSDLSIHWPAHTPRLREIIRSHRCPSWGVPRKLRNPGGLVALVDTQGNVQLLFRLARVESGVKVRAADGSIALNGCYLVARPGTMRKPRAQERRLGVNRRAFGAFQYFNAAEWRTVFYSQPETARSDPVRPSSVTAGLRTRRYPFFANNIGKALSQPEQTLIRAYVSWVGSKDPFEHQHLLGGTYTDLLIRPLWTIVEAKTSTHRDVLRGALGQLLDYQRLFARHPRLAVLLPSKPADSMLDLLDSKRVAVIWRSTGGAFRDSLAGHFTYALRSQYRKST